jgi:transposase-like protein
MRANVLCILVLLAGVALLQGCVAGSASKQANAAADQQMYQPIAYSDKQGPMVVVIPGEIKSANATFTQKVSSNNIADYAELELGKAHYSVLERSDLGPMLKEIEVAANLGDATQLKKFKKGKFKATNWLVRFDILKAEPVSEVKQSFDGRFLGAIAGSAIGGPGGYAADAGVSSVHASDEAAVWIVGLRYKILDANTGEQKATGYIEDKMEINSKGGGALGVSQSETRIVTLDTMAQRLVQKAVADMDKMK